MNHPIIQTVELPWPVSINRYLRRAGVRMHTTNEAKAYRRDVGWLCKGAHRFGQARMEVGVQAFPPDNRRRDLDNIFKVCLDALMHAGLFDDDSQIDRLHIERGPVRKNDGAVLVTLSEYRR